MMYFRPRMVLLGVRTMGDFIWEKYSPKTPRKRAWIGSFRPKRQNLYIAISAELLIRWTSDLRTVFRPRRHYVGGLPLPPKQIQHGWRLPCWTSIWRHITTLAGPIWTKFGSLMQNNTPVTAKWSISKPEIEFQYGGCLFFQTGSSNSSAVNGDMSKKCGLLIHFDLLKALTSTITKPEVVLSGGGRHVAKSIWCHITAVGGPIWTKCRNLTQNNTAITVKWLKMKPEVEFQYYGRLFFQTGSSHILAVNEICW